MIRRILASSALALSLLVAPALAAQHTPKTAVVSPAELAQFDNESAAQRHCPKDTVV
jgi:hypothetical protein